MEAQILPHPSQILTKIWVFYCKYEKNKCLFSTNLVFLSFYCIYHLYILKKALKTRGLAFRNFPAMSEFENLSYEELKKVAWWKLYFRNKIICFRNMMQEIRILNYFGDWLKLAIGEQAFSLNVNFLSLQKSKCSWRQGHKRKEGVYFGRTWIWTQSRRSVPRGEHSSD